MKVPGLQHAARPQGYGAFVNVLRIGQGCGNVFGAQVETRDAEGQQKHFYYRPAKGTFDGFSIQPHHSAQPVSRRR